MVSFHILGLWKKINKSPNPNFCHFMVGHWGQTNIFFRSNSQKCFQTFPAPSNLINRGYLHDLVHSFLPAQSQAPYLCKKGGAPPASTASVSFKSTPEWRPFHYIDLPFSLFCPPPFLSLSFPLFFFLSSFPSLFLLFWHPFSDPGGPRTPPGYAWWLIDNLYSGGAGHVCLNLDFRQNFP